MSINRRDFLLLTGAAAVCVAGDCLARADGGVSVVPGTGQVVDVGLVGNFAADGVYSTFGALGFFVVRKGEKLSAISSICTHRKVQIKAQPDCSFYCKRHGSTFDAGGHVTHGPAKRDLPVLATSVNAAGHLLVQVPAT